jgi:hypothetical protein
MRFPLVHPEKREAEERTDASDMERRMRHEAMKGFLKKVGLFEAAKRIKNSLTN